MTVRLWIVVAGVLGLVGVLFWALHTKDFAGIDKDAVQKDAVQEEITAEHADDRTVHEPVGADRVILPEHSIATAELAASVAVRVVDRNSRPLPGAAVVIARNDCLQRIGLTDKDGRVQVRAPLKLEEGDAVIASKKGFASEERYIALPVNKEILILLTPGLSIVGSVHGSGISPRDMPRFTVIGLPPGFEAVAPASGDWTPLLTDPRTLVGTCEADGSFVLVDAHESTEYQVTGGGAGYIHDGAPVKALGGSNSIDLPIVGLYGTCLRLSGISEGQRLPDAGGTGIGFTSTMTCPEARWCTARMVARLLAGIPAELTMESPLRLLLLATSNSMGLEALPAHVHWKMLGYGEIDLEVSLTRCIEGVAVLDVGVPPTKAGVGMITLEFSEQVASHAMRDGPGTLLMRSSAGEILHLPVRALDGHVARVGPLPAGDYTWRFDWRPEVPGTLFGGDTWKDVHVSEASAVVVTPQLDRVGSLRIDIVDSDRKRYTGPAKMAIGVLQDSERMPGHQEMTGDTLRFSSGPYLVPVLQAGHIDVLLSYPDTCGGVSRASVDIIAGEECQVVFRLKRSL
jgi:hypothetical protein